MNTKNDKGFIYCLYNPTFKSYGDNVYKLGKTKNLSNRMSSYTTSYIDKSEYIITSSELSNRNIAENILFKELEKYRINLYREFFKCDIKIIREAFEKVEKNLNLKTSSYTKDMHILQSKSVSKNDSNVCTSIESIKNIPNKNIFNCLECNKYYKSYKSLWNHNKKFHIKELKVKEFVCKHCKKSFDNKQNKYYHQKYCSNIIDNIHSNLQNIYEHDKNKTNINNYGNDNLIYISNDLIKQLFNDILINKTNILPKLLENIKFNPNHKENHNVKIKSDRSKIGFYYDQNKWKAINKNELLDDLCNYSLKILSKYFEEQKDKLSEDIITQFQQFSHIAKLKSELRNQIKEKIENIAYIFTINNENELDV